MRSITLITAAASAFAVAVLSAPIAAAEDSSPRVLPEDTTNVVFADPVDDALVESIRVYLEETYSTTP